MRLYDDLKSVKWLYLKGLLFLLLAMLAGGQLIARMPRIDVVLLLLICVWASCRAYYFAFYVIEHYAEPGYRYSGLIDFVRHAITKAREFVAPAGKTHGSYAARYRCRRVRRV